MASRFFLRGGGNYAYVSARVRAKRAALLPAEEYPKLLLRDANEVARYLQEGSYKAEIDELAGRFRGADLVERATRLKLGRVYSQILGFATGELQVMIAQYLGRYDAANVKTILRGKFADARPEEILAETVPTGMLADRLDELCRLDSIEAVVDALKGTPWGKVLATHTEGRQVANLVAVENALDKAYYESLITSIPTSGAANRAFHDWVRNEIDVVNLKTLFRLRFGGVSDWEPYFLEEGREVARETAQRIVRGTDDEVLQELAGLSLGQAVVDAARVSLTTRNLNAIATALDKELLREADDFSHRAPLSVLPVIDFILRKRIEADNLRAIAYGKQTGLPNATIEELLNL